MNNPLNIKLYTNRDGRIEIDSAIDDRNLAQPRGYTARKARYRLLRSLKIENTSNRPVRKPRLKINGKPLETIAELLPSERKATRRQQALHLFRYWTNNVAHYPVGIKNARHPFLLLNYWGYNICGFAAAFLSTILQKAGIAAQKLPVQGHVVHQYHIDGRWIILDADLNCAFRMPDNHRFAGFEDILEDPFLVHRTNTYGRYRAFNLNRNRFCASLYDRDPSGVKQPPAYDCNVFRMLSEDRTMYPGESIEYRYDKTVKEPLREKSSPHPRDIGEVSLMQVRYRFVPRARTAGQDGEKTMFTRYPIRRIRFTQSGREIELPIDRIVTRISMPAEVTEDIICICQCSRRAAPRLLSGANTVVLGSSDDAIEMKLTIELNSEVAQMSAPPAPSLNVKDAYVDEPVRFTWNHESAQTIWLQVFGDDQTPLLDYILEAEDRIDFHPIEQTFFDRDVTYRVRAKQQIDGIWSEWSEDSVFTVVKPETPRDVRIDLDASGAIQMSWLGEDDCEFLIFGSNRVDFVPDIYSTEEPIGGLDGTLDTIPVSNLIASTTGAGCRIEQPYVYYRVIALRGSCYSNPSALIDQSGKPGWMSRFELQAKALNTHHRMIDGKNRYETLVELI